MNACAFCKHGKRKCNKARPSCSNCIRLHRICIYTEDAVQSHFPATSAVSYAPPLAGSVPGNELFTYGDPKQSILSIAMRVIGSVDSMRIISSAFFTGTHQRIPALSKHRFYRELESGACGLHPNFATLCLSILLIQQTPSGKNTNTQSPLYATVKNFISLLEASGDVSLDLSHCKILVTFYEMGHGLHTAAYTSIAATARMARTLGLHRKRWRHLEADTDKLLLEEEKRAWWAICNMDRFINLCSGDAFLVTGDSERWDPLPIEDLQWSENLDPATLTGLICDPPTLETPVNTRVGQLARECQISHLAGRVVRHVFEPLSDRDFNVAEGFQLERTLQAYLPLLANEELEIGKYCGAFGICNSALFVLYEFMLSHCHGDTVERNRVLRSIQETSLRAINFAEATHNDRFENYPIETQSPYLIYSLYQAAVVQYRLWKEGGGPGCKQKLESLKEILHAFTKRWMIAWQYLELLEKLDTNWPPLALAFQRLFISTGRPRITS